MGSIPGRTPPFERHDKGSYIHIHIFIFEFFKEGSPSAEAVFQGALR